MTRLRGHFFDGQTSRRRDARLTIAADGTADLQHTDGSQRLRFSEIAVEPRLADTPRRFTLPDGGVFETTDNDAVDRALAAVGRGRGAGWIHRLESHWHQLAVAFVVMAIAAVSFVVWGIPSLARTAAFALPSTTSAAIGSGALEALDATYFEPSELTEDRRVALREAFARVAANAELKAMSLELVFRRGAMLGANALALPSGIVVLTDELVGLAQADAEIEAVLAHEVGHIVHRHSLRQVIQNSLVAVAVILLTGDLSSSTSLVAAVPTILAKTSFSRAFEREADAYAVAYLSERDIDTIHFANLLRRMAELANDTGIPGFLSTHPATKDRAQALENTR